VSCNSKSTRFGEIGASVKPCGYCALQVRALVTEEGERAAMTQKAMADAAVRKAFDSKVGNGLLALAWSTM
jgi:hypothetical protein